MTRLLTSVLRERAGQNPGQTALTALDENGAAVETLTWSELDTASRSLATCLLSRAEPGDRVVLPPLPGLRFHVAFLACLYAGLIAVPVPPVALREDPQRPGRLNRLLAVCLDAQPRCVIVPEGDAEAISKEWAAHPMLRSVTVVAADSRATPGKLPEVSAGSTAFLQYTSGSTSRPRGVMISHRALVTNQGDTYSRAALHCTPRTRIVSWLPLYHDMGLCLGLAQPIYSGIPAFQMEPGHFIARPESWLRAIAAAGPDVRSAGPDFAYAWTARRVRKKALEGLDLSGWRVGVISAEPVRTSTLRAFHAALAGCGLSETMPVPGYGLAEATLFVTGVAADSGPMIRTFAPSALREGRVIPDPQGQELVGCGAPGREITLAFVDPETRQRREPGHVGEIWVRTTAAGSGYWNRPDDTTATFGARIEGEPQDDWLRTGDLGFMYDGQLFVAGRQKDLIILNGVNYYPHDVESLAQQAHPLVEGSVAAAVSYTEPNRVVVVIEAATEAGPEEAELAAAAVLRHITSTLPIPADVVITERGRLPRTTSGKIRRGETATRLASGRVPVLARWPRPAVTEENS
ncbi:fatty acyl-AMP ligase [Kineosporia mesophila]|uniref:Fatty acyl-AMP ligase n=1 Tax=Kineosporia mesophila TaxID=566012 RepID=A0ABP6Z7N6_9ACTN|nr:fatty acyl-AMP ligase [Kineosporia mesophila]MCD5352978.1 fatty acyl-AMP ligase [Kineosporia mesophila]